MEWKADLPRNLTDEYTRRFKDWCRRAIAPTASGAIINATRTRLRHVKVEQIITGCHLYRPFDLNVPISIEFNKFIRGKPVIGNYDGTPHIRVCQNSHSYFVYDSGQSLDEMPDYACPSYTFRHTPRNLTGNDWLFTIIEPEQFSDAVQVGAMMRLYANMALALGKEAGFEFLVNLRMYNASLTPSRLLTAAISVEDRRMNFTYGFWGQPVTSTGESFYHPRFRREFVGELGLSLA